MKIKHALHCPQCADSVRFFPSSLLLLILVFSAGAAVAQKSQTIESIRVIGNRRIPKETILARMFTHPGDIYDPVSIERDFNSLWNTGYFRRPAH